MMRKNGFIVLIVLTITLGSCASSSSAGSSGNTVQSRTSIQEIMIDTVSNSTLVNGFGANSATYELVDIPADGRTNVIKIRRGDCDWNIINYSLADYRGKSVTIRISADVMRVGDGTWLNWQVNNEPDYPSVAWVNNAVSGVWYKMTKTYNITPTNNYPFIYLTSYGNDDPNTFFYFDNLGITIEDWDYRPSSTLAVAGEANSNGTRNYYVSTSRGQDSGNGTQASPFQKIANAMYYAKAGDTVLVDSGTYHERFKMPSGTSGKPVTLTAMPGAEVIITPTIQITPQWRQHAGNIYVADISQYVTDMDTEFPQLFANRDSMVEARYPNMGASMSAIMDYKRDVAQRGTNKNTVVASKNIPSDIAGARVVIWAGEDWVAGWAAFVSPVQSVNGRTIRLMNTLDKVATEQNADASTPYPGNPFYITGALSLLDAPGEYYFDPQTNLLYFYPPWNGSPDSRTLHVRSSIDIAINAENTTYVNIQYITIFGGGIYMMNSGNNSIENCRVNYAEHFYASGWDYTYHHLGSMVVTGSNNRISNCEFGPTAGSGITLGGDNHVFTNNIVHDVNYAGNDFAGVFVNESKNIEISHNTIKNSARSHIFFQATTTYSRNIVRNNYLENSGILCSDNGSFYTYQSDGGGTEIYNNFVVVGNKGDNGTMHRIRIGLYVDNYTSNYIIRNNIVIGGTHGVCTNLPSSTIQVFNNTLIDAEYGLNFYNFPTNNADANTTSITDNLFVNIKENDILYYGTENGRSVNYVGNFVNGTIPVPIRQEGRVQSSGNARGTVDNQYRPTGRTPDIGAIPRNGQMFPYGADWELEN